jgi:SAM-dependent methyltransferase
MFGEYERGFLDYISPLKPAFFRGKVVLDAGCGFGRFTSYAARYGAEVVGFDLSDAVEAAYRNCRGMKKVHIVQGDIYHLPFGKRFDFIMSIGVLHHLPDPKGGYVSLAGLMRKGTLLFAWLYGREGRTFKVVFLEGTIRRLTVRMPQRMLYYLCYVPAALYHFSNGLHNLLKRWGPTSGLAGSLPFKNYAGYPFGVKLADAYDFLGTPVNNYYTREECEEWARDAGLKDVSVTSLKGRSWRIFGSK